MNPLIPLAGSAGLGAALGVLVASTCAVPGVRPRCPIRRRRFALTLASGCAAGAAFAASLLGIIGSDQPRGFLGMTCAAIASLLCVGAWVLLVEPDDGGGEYVPDEPEWWPAFEQDFEKWARRERSPVGSPR